MVLHNVHLHGSFASRNGHATSLHLSFQLVAHTCKLAAPFLAIRPLYSSGKSFFYFVKQCGNGCYCFLKSPTSFREHFRSVLPPLLNKNVI